MDYAATAALPLSRAEVRLARNSPRATLPQRREIVRAPTGKPVASEATIAMSDDVMATALPVPGELKIFGNKGSDWIEQAKFDPNPQENHWVSLAVSGSLVVAGVPPNAAGEGDAGVVRTYRRGPSGIWAEAPVTTAPSAMADGYFGLSVALEGDVLAVGAPFASRGGSVAVYSWRVDRWDLRHELQGERPGDRFGWSVALHDGTLVVGAPGEDSVAGDPTSLKGWGTGAAYVFVHSEAESWTKAALLKAPDATQRAQPQCSGMGCMLLPRAVEEFGAAVAISESAILVGAPGAGSPMLDNSPVAPGPGAAYVFAGDARAPLRWKHLKTLEGPRELRRYGSSVAIDGDSLAVGAPSFQPRPGDFPALVESASVSVFTRNAAGAWIGDVEVTAPVQPGAPQARFALANGRMAASGFRRTEDGSVVDVLDLREVAR